MTVPSDLEKLLAYLEVERIDKYLFIGNSPKNPPRVFGGQVLAQALYAALNTVSEDRVAHSMHAYFLRPGDPSRQIVYEVDPIRDGRSFTTRRIVAKQDGVAIFNTSVSFQVVEERKEKERKEEKRREKKRRKERKGKEEKRREKMRREEKRKKESKRKQNKRKDQVENKQKKQKKKERKARQQ